MSDFNVLRLGGVPGFYTLYPRGVGASTGPTHGGYQLVSRWANVTEAKMWMATGGTYVPPQVGADGRVYVTLFGAVQPSGTGPIRIDFEIPKAALQMAGREDWRQLFQNLSNIPIHNVCIHVPDDVDISKITGRR
jgi:hypothetical protein